MAMHGHAWPYMATHGHPWPYMAMSGYAWPCITWKKSEKREVVKMAKNEEKQCFTFFGFLPPYIAVSCLTDVSMGKSAQFLIDWYRRCLLGRPVARAMAVFVSYARI